MRVEHSLAPIYDERSEVLILGSLPSVKSRSLGFYYAHPQNRFWKVMEQLFEVSLKTKEDKIEFLSDYHIALYDVIESCDIEGSSDASIKNVVPTDLNKILSTSNIQHIYTTGKKAFELYERYQYPNTKIKAILLPSTSPANGAYKIDRLLEAYQCIKDALRKKND